MFLKWEYVEVANRRFSLTSGCDWNTKTVNLDYFNFELGSHTNTEIHFYTLSSKLQKVNWETPKKIKRNLVVCKDLKQPQRPKALPFSPNYSSPSHYLQMILDLPTIHIFLHYTYKWKGSEYYISFRPSALFFFKGEHVATSEFAWFKYCNIH